MATKKGGTPGKKTRPDARRDAQRDAFDFRDLVYRPALVELPDELYPRWNLLHILDQGEQGACTGFGLAAMVNYLLAHKHGRALKAGERASARMLFQMAKRYDQWKGERYDWSSPRGAMKGWYRHGVCTEALWPNGATAPGEHLTPARQDEALKRPLGAYYRVLPRRTDVHAALREVGIVYAAAETHAGWDAKGRPVIDYKAGAAGGGGHAFAIIGYNRDGFLVQNSWGEDWGGFKQGSRARPGVALWRYEDFDRNVWDLWVARTALAVESIAALRGGKYGHGTGGTRIEASGPPVAQIAGHFVHIDDGQYDPQGEYATDQGAVGRICRDLVTGGAKHILLFAHGGLNGVNGSATRVGKWRPVFKANGIAELHFIWETGFFEELRDVLLGKEKFAKERVSGISSWWDDWIEKMSQLLGYPLWSEMRSDAEIAFDPTPAAGTHFISALKGALDAAGGNAPSVHMACHSAGSIWMGHLIERWQQIGGPVIEQLMLFAPACTVDLFREKIVPAVQAGLIGRLHHFQLDDEREQDDNVAGVYRKSLLYLVSRSFQDKNRVVPILGMQKYRDKVDEVLKVAGIAGRYSVYDPQTHSARTGAQQHGRFDNDEATMNSMIEFVLGAPPGTPFDKTSLGGY